LRKNIGLGGSPASIQITTVSVCLEEMPRNSDMEKLEAAIWGVKIINKVHKIIE
jgi:hypothetical protein